MRISDWSSDVCSSDLEFEEPLRLRIRARARRGARMLEVVRQLLQPLQSALQARGGLGQGELRTERVEIGAAQVEAARADRKSVVSGKSVSVRVDLGGRRTFTKKNQISIPF